MDNQLIEKYQSLSSTEKKKSFLEEKSKSISQESLLLFFYLTLYEKDNEIRKIAGDYLKKFKEHYLSQGENIDLKLRSYQIKWEIERYLSGDKNTKIEVLKSFSRWKSPIIFRNLLTLLNQEKDPVLLAALLKLIAYQGESKAIPILNKALNIPNSTLKLAAIEAFSYLKQVDISVYLEPYLFESELDLVLEVARILWTLRPLLVRKRIQELLKEVKTKEEKLKIIEKLKDLSSIDAKNLIFKLADDKEVGEYARKVAAEMTIKIGESSSSKVELDFSDISFETDNIYSQIKKEKNIELGIKKLEYLYQNPTEENFNFCFQFLSETKNPFYLSSLTKNLPQMAKALGKEREVREKVVLYLSSSDERVRANTVEGLSKIADAKIIGIFLDMIKRDSSPRVVGVLSKFLLTVDEKKVIEILKEILKRGVLWKNSFLTLIASDFEFFKKYSGLFELIKTLEGDEVPEIANKAKALVYQLKEERKNESKKEIDLSIIDKIISEGIPDDIVEKQFELLEKTDDIDLKIKALHFLSSLVFTKEHRERYLKIIKKMLASETDERVLATLVIVAGRVYQQEIIPYIKPFLTHQSARVRANTVEVIGELLEEEKELEELLSPFLSDTSSRVVVNTILLLYKKNYQRAKQKLEELFSSSKSEDINSAIFAVRTLREKSFLPKLRELTTHKDDRVSFHASYALLELEKDYLPQKLSLSQLSLKEKLNHLIDSFLYGDLLTRKLAIDELQKIFVKEKEDVLPFVEEILERNNNEYVLSLLVKLIGFTGSSRIIPIIQKFLKHENDRVRANAIEGLIMLSTPKIKRILEEQLLRETDSRVLNNIVIGLSKFDKKMAKEVMESLKNRNLLEDYHLQFLEKIFSSQKKSVSSAEKKEKSRKIEKQGGRKSEKKKPISSSSSKVKPSTSQKSKSSIGKVAVIIFFILLIGGSYYWFYWRVPSHEISLTQKIKVINKYVESNDYNNLIRTIDTIAEKEMSPELIYLKGWALYHLGKYKKAKFYLDSVGNTATLTSKLKALRRMVEEKLNENKKENKVELTLKDLKNRLKSNLGILSDLYFSNLKEVKLSWKKLSLLLNSSSKSNCKFCQDALKEIKKKNTLPDNYLLSIKKSFSKYKSSPQFNYLLSFLFYQRGKYPKSLSYILKSIFLDSSFNLDYLELWGDILFSLGKLRESLKIYSFLTEKFPTNSTFSIKEKIVSAILTNNQSNLNLTFSSASNKEKIILFLKHSAYRNLIKRIFNSKKEKKDNSNLESLSHNFSINSSKANNNFVSGKNNATLEELKAQDEDIFNLYKDE